MKVEEILVRKFMFDAMPGAMWLIPSGYEGMYLKAWEDEAYNCGIDWVFSDQVDPMVKKMEELDEEFNSRS